MSDIKSVEGIITIIKKIDEVKAEKEIVNVVRNCRDVFRQDRPNTYKEEPWSYETQESCQRPQIGQEQ